MAQDPQQVNATLARGFALGDSAVAHEKAGALQPVKQQTATTPPMSQYTHSPVRPPSCVCTLTQAYDAYIGAIELFLSIMPYLPQGKYQTLVGSNCQELLEKAEALKSRLRAAPPVVPQVCQLLPPQPIL